MNDVSKRPQHAAMNQFELVDDCLQVGGIALPQLAARAGRTPFFAYDRALLTRRVGELRAVLPQAIELHYAMKANPMPALVQHMAGLVDGLDVASAGELKVALDAGMDAAEISFAGPGKMPWELRQAIAAGVVLNLESERELETAAALSEELGIAARVAVRVNPDFELKASGMKMGGGPKQFGVDAERVPAMLTRIGELAVEFTGFHIYSGSQNLKPEALIDAHDKTLALGSRLAEHAPSPVKLFNIGGGFGIPYFPGDQHLDLGPVAENLEVRLAEARNTLPEARFIVELGRYLVGEAGVYVTEVVDRKVSRDHVFLIVNGGLHHQLAASGNFGQVIRKNYPLAAATRVHGGPRETVSVVGPLCTPLDLLGDKMTLGRAEVGDLIVVFQSGAYGLTASPNAFLGHPEPLELLV